MKSTERKNQISAFGQGYDQLMAALNAIGRSTWHLPPAAGEWSIRQIVFHLEDAEANSYIRLRRAIAEPGSRVLAYDQGAWMKALDYGGRNLDDSIEVFRWLLTSS